MLTAPHQAPRDIFRFSLRVLAGDRVYVVDFHEFDIEQQSSYVFAPRGFVTVISEACKSSVRAQEFLELWTTAGGVTAGRPIPPDRCARSRTLGTLLGRKRETGNG